MDTGTWNLVLILTEVRNQWYLINFDFKKFNWKWFPGFFGRLLSFLLRLTKWVFSATCTYLGLIWWNKSDSSGVLLKDTQLSLSLARYHCTKANAGRTSLLIGAVCCNIVPTNLFVNFVEQNATCDGLVFCWLAFFLYEENLFTLYVPIKHCSPLVLPAIFRLFVWANSSCNGKW